MQPETHLGISPHLVGEIEHLEPGAATVSLLAITEMMVDEKGLVHGGFTFGLADYAAMLAVNHPHVVLGSATSRFLAPVRVGERMRAHARLLESKGKKHVVSVEVHTHKKVLEAELTCFVLDRHVLEA